MLLLALRRADQLGETAQLIMGTGERRRTVLLKPIYDYLGPQKSKALINWHALTGCDTTGHIQGKGKQTCFKAYLEADVEALSAIEHLGEGDHPSESVIKGCETFLCSLFCPKDQKITKSSELRWYLFKQLKEDQGVEKLSPTPGAWREHILRAHLQANIWQQDLVSQPSIPESALLGWSESDGHLKPVLTRVSIAPESILQLVRCNCKQPDKRAGTLCHGRCSCKKANVVCTELCKCEAEDRCNNVNVLVPSDDIQD